MDCSSLMFEGIYTPKSQEVGLEEIEDLIESGGIRVPFIEGPIYGYLSRGGKITPLIMKNKNKKDKEGIVPHTVDNLNNTYKEGRLLLIREKTHNVYAEWFLTKTIQNCKKYDGIHYFIFSRKITTIFNQNEIHDSMFVYIGSFTFGCEDRIFHPLIDENDRCVSIHSFEQKTYRNKDDYLVMKDNKFYYCKNENRKYICKYMTNLGIDINFPDFFTRMYASKAKSPLSDVFLEDKILSNILGGEEREILPENRDFYGFCCYFMSLLPNFRKFDVAMCYYFVTENVKALKNFLIKITHQQISYINGDSVKSDLYEYFKNLASDNKKNPDFSDYHFQEPEFHHPSQEKISERINNIRIFIKDENLYTTKLYSNFKCLFLLSHYLQYSVIIDEDEIFEDRELEAGTSKKSRAVNIGELIFPLKGYL